MLLHARSSGPLDRHGEVPALPAGSPPAAPGRNPRCLGALGNPRPPDHQRLRPAADLRLLRLPARDLRAPLRCARRTRGGGASRSAAAGRERARRSRSGARVRPWRVRAAEGGVPRCPDSLVEMSVERNLDPKLHIAAGRALASLRDEGVLIIGSGMSFHDLKAFGDKRFTRPSQVFDSWLTSTLMQPGDVRADLLAAWAEAPGARAAHPTAEHLIPLMVAAGPSDAPGAKIYGELVLETAVSGFRFD